MRTVDSAAGPSASCRVSLLAVVAVAVLFGFSPEAQGRTRCSYAGPPTSLLTVTVDRDGLAELRTAGQEIRVRESSQRRQACSGGVPTVLNTDTIRVLMRGLFTGVVLRLDGGPFAPGATTEAEGASEIEIEFSGRGNLGRVIGTPRADEFHWAPAGAQPGFNLNPRSANDQDADVTVTSPFTALIVQGAAGKDAIIPAPGAVINESASSVGSDGGPGNDLLVAPRDHGGILDGESGNDTTTGSTRRDLLYGAAGNDRVTGAGGRDQIIGGAGRDLLSGGPGRDHIHSRDSRRDRVRCGPGRDFVRADPLDRLHGCERVAAGTRP